jgi:signal peptidase I
MLQRYRTWRKHRRGLKEARLLLREARRGLRKYAHRITDKGQKVLKECIDALSKAAAERNFEELPGALNAMDRALDDYLASARKSTAREYAESIGVAVLIALFLRAFVVEAFKIPSGSMIPTLQVGDHIFVNKFIYGVRIPWLDVKIGMDYRKPKKGEVIVFRYPREPEKDFIKRIVAVEGDTIEMKDDQLFVNGEPVVRRHKEGPCRYFDVVSEETGQWEQKSCDEFSETIDGNTFSTILAPGLQNRGFAARTVPPQHVFVMGDNRDNSHDSRYWGFVPFDYIKGKAMVIWFSRGEPEGWIRFGRLFQLVN